MALSADEKVRASAARLNYPAPVFVLSKRRGPTGKPMAYRSLGVVDPDGKLLKVAYVNRRSAVYWGDPFGWEVES